MEGNNGTEFNPNTPYPGGRWSPNGKEQRWLHPASKRITSDKGGSMRLGGYHAALTEGSLARRLGSTEVDLSNVHRQSPWRLMMRYCPNQRRCRVSK